MNACPACGAPVPTRVGPGRPAVYCSKRCGTRARVARHRAGQLPAALTSRPHWVRHVRKRPITVDGRPASVTDPSTWTTYADASASTRGHGLGFVLGAGIGGVDLDDVIDAEGRLHPDAAELLAELPPTYTEVSPSGRGLHLYYRMPEGRGTRRSRGGITVETYSRRRYFTITKKRWRGTPGTLADWPA